MGERGTREAFGVYPTDHDGSGNRQNTLRHCDKQRENQCKMSKFRDQANSPLRTAGIHLPSVEFDEISFDGILAQSQDVIARIAEYDLSVVDANTNKMFEIPIGPEAKLDLSGEDYVLKFYLPNLYFHLTTAYNLARAAGVPIGKLDFMGPVFP